MKYYLTTVVGIDADTPQEAELKTIGILDGMTSTGGFDDFYILEIDKGMEQLELEFDQKE